MLASEVMVTFEVVLQTVVLLEDRTMGTSLKSLTVLQHTTVSTVCILVPNRLPRPIESKLDPQLTTLSDRPVPFTIRQRRSYIVQSELLLLSRLIKLTLRQREDMARPQTLDVELHTVPLLSRLPGRLPV